MMEKLLQWALPEIQGDSTQIVTLPTIQEEEEYPPVVATKTKKIKPLTKEETAQINDFLQRCLQRNSCPLTRTIAGQKSISRIPRASKPKGQVPASCLVVHY
jgi:hypothetical protein